MRFESIIYLLQTAKGCQEDCRYCKALGVLPNLLIVLASRAGGFVNEAVELHHFRTSDGKEVVFVLERPDGRIAAIEVKRRDSVNAGILKA